MFLMERWLEFDANKAVFDCRKDSVEKITTYLENFSHNMDIASIINYSPSDKQYFMKNFHFFECPVKITWRRPVEPIDQYIKSVRKGRDMKRGINLMQPGGRYERVRFEVDPGLQRDDWFQQFDEFYKEKIGAKEKGRITMDEKPTGHTGFYAFKNGDFLGGRLVKDLGPRFSASFSVFERDPKYLDDVAYVKMMEEAIKQGKKEVSLGVDVNFYGYHLSIGLLKSKMSFGFNPYYYNQAGKNLFTVIDHRRFSKPYLFFSFINGTEKVTLNAFTTMGTPFNPRDYEPPGGITVHRIGY